MPTNNQESNQQHAAHLIKMRSNRGRLAISSLLACSFFLLEDTVMITPRTAQSHGNVHADYVHDAAGSHLPCQHRLELEDAVHRSICGTNLVCFAA